MDPRVFEAVAPPSERVRRHREKYVGLFPHRARVLDIGCAGGTVLDLLRAHGLRAVGVEIAPRAAQAARARGHEVHAADAAEFLRGRPGPFGGILLAHVIEHLTPPAAWRLLALCARELSADGTLVLLTPNYRDFTVRPQFWADPTHVRPYPPRLLQALASAAGLQVVLCGEDPDNVLRDPDLALWQRTLRRLHNLVRRWIIGNYWYLGDLVLIARKGAAGEMGTE